MLPLSVEIESHILYGMGMECMEHEKYEEALKHFEKSLNLKQRSLTAARIYECLLHLKRGTEARRYIEMAFMLNSQSDSIAVQYAAVLLQEKKVKKAESILRTVLDRTPSFAPAKKLLATIDV